MRDSLSGEEFSIEPAVYESSLYRLVRSELKRVVESYGLYCEQDDSDLDLSVGRIIFVFN